MSPAQEDLPIPPLGLSDADTAARELGEISVKARGGPLRAYSVDWERLAQGTALGQADLVPAGPAS